MGVCFSAGFCLPTPNSFFPEEKEGEKGLSDPSSRRRDSLALGTAPVVQPGGGRWGAGSLFSESF